MLSPPRQQEGPRLPTSPDGTPPLPLPQLSGPRQVTSPLLRRQCDPCGCFPGKAGHPLSKGRENRTPGGRPPHILVLSRLWRPASQDCFLPIPGTPDSSPHLLLARLMPMAQAQDCCHRCRLQKAAGSRLLCEAACGQRNALAQPGRLAPQSESRAASPCSPKESRAP